MTEEQYLELRDNSVKTQLAIENLHRTLLGNGQPGVVQNLYTQLHTKADACDLKEIKDTAEDLDRKVNWMMGIGSTLMFVISTFLAYFGLHRS